MLPVEENDCSDKSNPLGKVSSRAGETTFFKALENSKRANCRLVETKHLLLSTLEYKFSVFSKVGVSRARDERFREQEITGNARRPKVSVSRRRNTFF